VPRTWLSIVKATLWLALSAVSAFGAVIVLPAYTGFVVVWLHAPLAKVISVTGPAAFLLLLVAVGAAVLAMRDLKANQ
jgi:hypothetical protein